MESSYQSYGEKLRENRELKGMSREELAIELDVSEGYIAKLEQNVKHPSPKLRIRIERFFAGIQPMPNWLQERLQKVADDLGSTPQDIINTLVYQFVKEA